MILAAKAAIFKEDLNSDRKEEIPFNSARKLMSVLCKLNRENYVFTKGAPELLIEKCRKIQTKQGIFTLTEKNKKQILESNKKFTSSAYRTLALAYKKIDRIDKEYFEKDLIFLGIVAIEDPPREEGRIRKARHAVDVHGVYRQSGRRCTAPPPDRQRVARRR